MSDTLARLRLPVLLLFLALLVGGSKLEALRPIEGEVIAFLIPAFAVLSGVAPFADAGGGLRAAAFGLGAVVLGVAELGSYRVVVDGAVEAPGLARVLLLVLGLACAVVLEVGAAGRGLRTRIAAWVGMAVVFGWYFPGHAALDNLFGSVFAAFLIALIFGGATGLFVGEVAVRKARA